MHDSLGWNRLLLALAAAAGCLSVFALPLAAESRDEWQQPERVMAELGLKAGDVVADVGCGGGYFTFRLASAVGDKGKVYAVDISDDVLKEVRQRVERGKVTNVEVIKSEPTDTKLGPESISAALLCDVIHEVPEAQRGGLMGSIAKALKAGGYLFFIDYRKSRDVTFDPYERLVPRDDLVKLATEAGLVLDAEYYYLKYQVFFRFRKAPAKRSDKTGVQPSSTAVPVEGRDSRSESSELGNDEAHPVWGVALIGERGLRAGEAGTKLAAAAWVSLVALGKRLRMSRLRP